MSWFFDDENGHSLSFNDNDDDESESTVTYFIEKDDFTGLGKMKHWHIFDVIAKKR